MFIYRRRIHVQDTDATGVVYFANQLQIGLEAFEEYLALEGFSIGEMAREGKFLLPIVHTEGDFMAPATVGDLLEVKMKFTHVGTTSFTHGSEFYKRGELIGTTSIVHVVYSPTKQQGIPIPGEIKDLISGSKAK